MSYTRGKALNLKDFATFLPGPGGKVRKLVEDEEINLAGQAIPEGILMATDTIEVKGKAVDFVITDPGSVLKVRTKKIPGVDFMVVRYGQDSTDPRKWTIHSIKVTPSKMSLDPTKSKEEIAKAIAGIDAIKVPKTSLKQANVLLTSLGRTPLEPKRKAPKKPIAELKAEVKAS